jgi:hypothetical protein
MVVPEGNSGGFAVLGTARSVDMMEQLLVIPHALASGKNAIHVEFGIAFVNASYSLVHNSDNLNLGRQSTRNLSTPTDGGLRPQFETWSQGLALFAIWNSLRRHDQCRSSGVIV